MASGVGDGEDLRKGVGGDRDDDDCAPPTPALGGGRVS
jgi:hypothetical protein